MLRRLVNDVDGLIDRQVELARQEVTDNVRQVTRGGRVLAAGVVLLLGACVSLVVLVVALLGLFLALWLAALVALLFFALAGGVVTLVGWRRVSIRPLAETRAALREDVEWARQQLRPGER